MKNKKPDYLIIHLITSLPLIVLNLLNIKTKMILRISGFPKLNYLREKLWTFSEKKIFKITCPTNDLKNSLIDKKIFNQKKVIKLSDPVINMQEFITKKKDKKFELLDENENSFFIAAGRLTRQKNFIYLIKEFKKFVNIYPNEKLLIFGEGELKHKIMSEIKNNNLSNNIKLLGYTYNIYKYMLKSKAFILSSLWEDPGFVMIESALCNTPIISSDCKNGPREFLLDGKAGLLYRSNINNELFKKLKEFHNLENDYIFRKRVLAKKYLINFTMFRHFLGLKAIIAEN